MFFNTIALPRNNIGADVWGESSIMTGLMMMSFICSFRNNNEHIPILWVLSYQRWCSSQATLHIGWGLCDRVCQVLVCRGRYGFGGGGSSLHSGIEFGLQEQIKDIIIIGVGQ